MNGTLQLPELSFHKANLIASLSELYSSSPGSSDDGVTLGAINKPEGREGGRKRGREEKEEEKSLWDADKLLMSAEFLFPHLKNKRAAQTSPGSIFQFSKSSPLAPGTPFPAPVR